MALMPHYYTTSNTRKRRARAKAPGIMEAEAEIKALLASKGYKPLTRGQKRRVPKEPEVLVRERKIAPTSNKIDGYCPLKQEMTYSGERKLLGIAVMHKSNLVPVFADQPEEVAEIGRMRRG